MNKKTYLLSGFILLIISQINYAAPDRTQLVVWANEAIIATYTFNYKTYLEQQKNIAKYFSSDGWIAYSKALNDSKIPEVVQTNAYDVTAVATSTPKLTSLDPTHWLVTMNVLVAYENPQYQQQQHLKVDLKFAVAPAGQGVRGLHILSLQSTVSQPPCKCSVEKPEANALPKK